MELPDPRGREFRRMVVLSLAIHAVLLMLFSWSPSSKVVVPRGVMWKQSNDPSQARKTPRGGYQAIAEISPARLISFASPRLCSELGVEESDLIGADPLSLVHSHDPKIAWLNNRSSAGLDSGVWRPPTTATAGTAK